jgi:parallel beta-helix repeat protein
MSGSFLRAILINTIILTSAALSSATVYYVDSGSGNDNNNGTTISTPWKTLKKVSSSSFSPGDQILLKRGSTWREQLNVPSSGAPGQPIVIGAYGSGSPPLINGADLVENWSLDTGYIYQAPILWAPSHVWSHSVLLTKVSSLEALTAAGEWFYSSGTLYVWTPGNESPAAHPLEADRRARAIDIASRSYITIDDISMKDSTSALVGVWNAANVSVIKSELKNAWIDVYVTNTSPGLVVDHCIGVADPGYVGRNFVLVSSVTADGPVVSNNVVGDLSGFIAIMFNDVNNARANGNTITGSGSGIESAATTRSVTGGQIYENAIFNSDHRLVDGESIKLRGNPPYTVSAQVYRNYVQGGPYTWDGVGGWYAINSQIYGNIVTGTTHYGMQFTSSVNNMFANNTLYGNPTAGLALYNNGSAQVENNIIERSATGISSDPSVAVTEVGVEKVREQKSFLSYECHCQFFFSMFG